jgi:hypothetical protein
MLPVAAHDPVAPAGAEGRTTSVGTINDAANNKAAARRREKVDIDATDMPAPSVETNH